MFCLAVTQLQRKSNLVLSFTDSIKQMRKLKASADCRVDCFYHNLHVVFATHFYYRTRGLIIIITPQPHTSRNTSCLLSQQRIQNAGSPCICIREVRIKKFIDVDVDVDVVDLRAQADASMPASNNNVNYTI